MGKVKVDKVIFEALNHFKNRVGEENFKKRLNYDLCLNRLEEEEKVLYSQLTLEKLVDIAYSGYELEKTTEEIISERFNRVDYEKNEFSEGVRFGIRFALNAYGIKIKGVND